MMCRWGVAKDRKIGEKELKYSCAYLAFRQGLFHQILVLSRGGWVNFNLELLEQQCIASL